MTDVTARFALPMIVPGQAQKEMTHNEALAVLDAVTQPSVAGYAVDTPPDAPDLGASWIVGDDPTGAWAGQERRLATWTAGGWRFVAPTAGFRAWVEDDAVDARFVDGVWQRGTLSGRNLVLDGETMLAEPAAAIATPADGSTVDAEARTAIAAILTALRHHNLIKAA